MEKSNTTNGRELLFKGKTIGPNGVWVKGNGVLHSKNHSYSWIVRIVNGAADLIPVVPETVCQYSGLRDDKRTEEYPKGQRMFEGDVVTGLFSFGMSIYAVVAFQDGAFGLEWYSGSVKRFTAFTSICNASYEVLGNIFDNPDLIRKEN